MNYACPKCSSDQIQPFRIIYESGTSDNISQSTGVGIGMAGGNLGIGVGGATNRSVSMSRIAQKVAPPEKRSTPSLLQWVICTLIFFPLFFLLLFLQIKNSKWNRTEWPRLLDTWENSWLCHRCGHTFLKN